MKHSFFIFLLLGYKIFAVQDPNVQDSAMMNFSSPALKQHSEAYAGASAEADHYLALIDQQQYGAAWNDMGPILQQLVSLEIWTEGVRLLRRPLGLVTERKMVSHERLSKIPGDLTGDFYRINFRSQFSGESRTETLLLISHGLGRWRVISYAIK
jgi:hypothetical protein